MNNEYACFEFLELSPRKFCPSVNSRSCFVGSQNWFTINSSFWYVEIIFHFFLQICPNGEIQFEDGVYQNYPYNYGTRPEQRTYPSVSPYWSQVDLSAFATGESKVRFASYHIDTNPRAVVFNKVNQDVKGFTNRPDFEATWVAVVTFEDIRPHDRTIRGFKGVS